MFETCGSIKRVRIIKNDEGNSKGFGFVDFYEVDSAKNAMKKSGEHHSGREIHVDFSIPRSQRDNSQGNERSRGFGGGDRGFSRGGNRGFSRGGNRGGSRPMK